MQEEEILDDKEVLLKVIKDELQKIKEEYGTPRLTEVRDSITEIKLIDPKDIKQYFDWGVIGDRIIERAVELKSKL